jgi:ABC-type lipoprotein release transport system permease subunit
MALGAHDRQVLKMIMAEGFRVVVIGLSIGLAAALAVSRYLETLLFHVTRYDPATFVTVTALLALTLTAVLLPARRATLVEPSAALKEE